MEIKCSVIGDEIKERCEMFGEFTLICGFLCPCTSHPWDPARVTHLNQVGIHQVQSVSKLQITANGQYMLNEWFSVVRFVCCFTDVLSIGRFTEKDVSD